MLTKNFQLRTLLGLINFKPFKSISKKKVDFYLCVRLDFVCWCKFRRSGGGDCDGGGDVMANLYTWEGENSIYLWKIWIPKEKRKRRPNLSESEKKKTEREKEDHEKDLIIKEEDEKKMDLIFYIFYIYIFRFYKFNHVNFFLGSCESSDLAAYFLPCYFSFYSSWPHKKNKTWFGWLFDQNGSLPVFLIV